MQSRVEYYMAETDTVLYADVFMDRSMAPNNNFRLIIDVESHKSSPCLLTMLCSPCSSLMTCKEKHLQLVIS